MATSGLQLSCLTSASRKVAAHDQRTGGRKEAHAAASASNNQLPTRPLTHHVGTVFGKHQQTLTGHHILKHVHTWLKRPRLTSNN